MVPLSKTQVTPADARTFFCLGSEDLKGSRRGSMSGSELRRRRHDHGTHLDPPTVAAILPSLLTASIGFLGSTIAVTVLLVALSQI